MRCGLMLRSALQGMDEGNGRANTTNRRFRSAAGQCRPLDPSLSDRAATVLLEIERVVIATFPTGGPALFNQRFVDLRAQPAERGNTITMLARAGWPGHALVAWEEPQPRRPRVNTPPSAVPQASAGFGLCSDSGHGIRLGRTKNGLVALPGDLYGPTSRLVFRVDQAL